MMSYGLKKLLKVSKMLIVFRSFLFERSENLVMSV